MAGETPELDVTLRALAELISGARVDGTPIDGVGRPIDVEWPDDARRVAIARVTAMGGALTDLASALQVSFMEAVLADAGARLAAAEKRRAPRVRHDLDQEVGDMAQFAVVAIRGSDSEKLDALEGRLVAWCDVRAVSSERRDLAVRQFRERVAAMLSSPRRPR